MNHQAPSVARGFFSRLLACNPAFCRCEITYSDWFTIMRSTLSFVVCLLAMSAAAARAEPPKLAVFDLEMIDTSLQGEVNGPQADEQARLLRTGEQVRKELAESGRFQVLDIAPVNAAAHGSNLQACGGCDVKLAGELGADLAITGVVQKVSNLILNINLYLRDVHTGQLVAAASADMRGNTDESWSRATDYLIRNRLLAPNYGAPQAR
nr:DUF3280 domain-containing protein [uncultured Bradyrhizobium sp.]